MNYMSNTNETICSDCGISLKYYDTVSRIIRTKERNTNYIKVQRFKCPECGSIHRNLPDYIYPYKQYEAEIIDGVIEGLITCNTIGFEDYPCEMTMYRWKNQKALFSL